MITRKVKLAVIGGLDLIYIHKPYPSSCTGLHSHSPQKPKPCTPTHGPNIFFSVECVSQETLVHNLFSRNSGSQFVRLLNYYFKGIQRQKSCNSDFWTKARMRSVLNV